MRLKTYKTPAWAMKLILEVSHEEGVLSPSVRWQKRDSEYSTGSAWPWHITIRAGRVRRETKEVVLHEMAHVVMGQTATFAGHTAHGAEFYAKLFEIAKRHGVGAQYIKQRERHYKPRGLKAGYRLYLRQLRGEA